MVYRLVDTAEAVFGSLHSTIMYYSTWNHLKELVLVPYRKTPRTTLKSTVFKSKAGTTTILISSIDATKKTAADKTDGSTIQSKTGSKSGNSGSGTTTTAADNGRRATLRSQFHKPDRDVKTTSYSPEIVSTKAPQTAKRKSVIIEEVSHAKEVEDYLMEEVYFGQSKTPRNHRPSSVSFGVGQVVRHKMAEYVGVIIGWDTVAKVLTCICIVQVMVCGSSEVHVALKKRATASGVTLFSLLPKSMLYMVWCLLQAPEKWMKQYYTDRKVS